MPADLATTTKAEIEEERRLLYVAMTRAKDHLHLMVPQRFYVPRPARWRRPPPLRRPDPLHPIEPVAPVRSLRLAAAGGRNSHSEDGTRAGRHPRSHAPHVALTPLEAAR